MPQPIRLMAYAFHELAPYIRDRLVEEKLHLIERGLCHQAGDAVRRIMNKAFNLRLDNVSAQILMKDRDAFYCSVNFSMTAEKVAKLVGEESEDKKAITYTAMSNGKTCTVEVHHGRIHMDIVAKGKALVEKTFREAVAEQSVLLTTHRTTAAAIEQLSLDQYISDGRTINTEELILSILDSKDRFKAIDDRMEEIERSLRDSCCHKCR